jgi:DNA polymerase-3 subunit epsilon
MNLNNEILIIDLETTANVDIKGYQTNNDIIQIGYFLLDKNLTELYSNEVLVKPREEITQFITDLTGITNEKVKNADNFDVVWQNIENTMKYYVKNIKNIRLCAWGTYFDIPIIRRLCREYDIKYNFSGTAWDIKSWAALYMALAGKRTDKLSVEEVAKRFNIKPIGRYHDAYVDAHMEKEILVRIMKDLNNGTFFNGNLVKLLKQG